MSEPGAGEGMPREQGAALMKLGRFPEAAAALRRAVEQDPGDEGAWRLLGGALGSGGDAAGAVAAFEKATVLAPGAAKNHYNLAVALQNAGKLYEAKSAFERALALDPNYAQARTALDSLIAHSAARGYGSAPAPQTPSPTPGVTSARAPDIAPAGDVRPAGGMPRMDDDLASVGGGGAPSAAHGGNAGTAVPHLASGAAGTGYAPPPVLGMGYGAVENTSGMKGAVPAQVQGGWNWGAFWFTWIWLFAHRVYGWAWGLVGATVVYLIGYVNMMMAVVRTVLSNPRGGAPPAGAAAGFMGGSILFTLLGWAMFGVSIYLGIAGNRMGWQHRRFASVEDYRACERTWARWVLGVFLVCFFVFFVPMLLAILLPVLAAARRAGGG